jgi:two-component system repressor protein LuxO
LQKKQVLAIEDNEPLVNLIRRFLEDEDIDVVHENTAAGGIEYLTHKIPAAVLLDLNLPDKNGIEVLKEITRQGMPTEVIVITGHGSVSNAVEAMANGAFDFMEKPFTSERLLVSVRNALEHRKLREIVDQIDELNRSFFCGFIGRSPKMQAVYTTIENAASSKATIFILGESGTGKELAAQAIHKLSPRTKGPFIPLNCAAIPTNLVESEIFGHVKGAFTGAVKDREGAVSRADNGTLFLDEICEMDIELQSKMLRFLQSGQFQRVGGNSIETVDVRIVCATNREPMNEVKVGRFREDLYYRLNVIPISLPPLSERERDTLYIARHLLVKFSKEENKNFEEFNAEVENLLLSYPWPGNVRELENVLRNIIVLNNGRSVTLDMVPDQIKNDQSAVNKSIVNIVQQNYYQDSSTGSTNDSKIKPLWQVESEAIERAITLCGGNIPKAAALLDISPSTIYRKKQSWNDNKS